MKETTMKVRELMVPLEEYASVSENATMYEAVRALERAQENLDMDRYKYLHRGVLVFNKKKKIVGKISQLDILRGLEPKYQKMGDPAVLARAGFSTDFLHCMLEQYSLFSDPLSEICNKATNMRVKDIMSSLVDGEYVEADATLNIAIHCMVMGHFQSLLVSDKKRIVGVLRLTDVFMEVFHKMENCCFVEDI